LGEHRSDLATWRTPYGSLTVTGVRAGQRDHIELRASIRLSGQLPTEVAGRLLLVGVNLVIQAVLAGRMATLRAAYQRLTGVRVR
jgi:hypothetical protein